MTIFHSEIDGEGFIVRPRVSLKGSSTTVATIAAGAIRVGDIVRFEMNGIVSRVTAMAPGETARVIGVAMTTATDDTVVTVKLL